MIVKEIIINGGLVRFHDDYMRSPEESLEIMKGVEDNAYRILAAKYSRNKESKTQNEDGTV